MITDENGCKTFREKTKQKPLESFYRYNEKVSQIVKEFKESTNRRVDDYNIETVKFPERGLLVNEFLPIREIPVQTKRLEILKQHPEMIDYVLVSTPEKLNREMNRLSTSQKYRINIESKMFGSPIKIISEPKEISYKTHPFMGVMIETVWEEISRENISGTEKEFAKVLLRK